MDFDGAIAVARLINELGAVTGRKRLQKLVHLLGASKHQEFKQDFILYYYGPFSRELAEQLDFLVNAEIIKEECVNNSYAYTVVDEEKLNKLYDSDNDVPVWSARAKSFQKDSTSFLEALSTVVFLKDQGIKAGKLRNRFAEVKPHLIREFKNACAREKKLSLISGA